MASKIMTYWSRQSEGTDYIVKVLGKEVSQICSGKYGSLEINPEHARPEDDIPTNVETLARIEQGIVDSIVGSVGVCPLQFRVVCSYLHKYCATKFPDQALRAVGGFIILRFFSAAIVAPEANGLAEEAPPLDARRILVLVSKTIQNLSNHTMFRESFMETSFNAFLEDNQPKVDAFLREVSQVPAFAEGLHAEGGGGSSSSGMGTEGCRSVGESPSVSPLPTPMSSSGSPSPSPSPSPLMSSLPSSFSSSSSSSSSSVSKEEFEKAVVNLAVLCNKNVNPIQLALKGPDAVNNYKILFKYT